MPSPLYPEVNCFVTFDHFSNTPTADNFPFAEERRLFYVALTRAKRQMRIYARADSPSRFVLEPSQTNQLMIEAVAGKMRELCPQCPTGVLIERRARQGKDGTFLGCSQFPSCDYTRGTRTTKRS